MDIREVNKINKFFTCINNNFSQSEARRIWPNDELHFTRKYFEDCNKNPITFYNRLDDENQQKLLDWYNNYHKDH